jgi:hypothetical protein
MLAYVVRAVYARNSNTKSIFSSTDILEKDAVTAWQVCFRLYELIYESSPDILCK